MLTNEETVVVLDVLRVKRDDLAKRRNQGLYLGKVMGADPKALEEWGSMMERDRMRVESAIEKLENTIMHLG